MGCIIFIIVASALQVDILSSYPFGEINYSIISTDNEESSSPLTASIIDPVLKQYSNII